MRTASLLGTPDVSPTWPDRIYSVHLCRESRERESIIIISDTFDMSC